ncbi:MAG TPA: RagB/SusD family nutrient uptake outer membrane protein [Sphingobacterium bovisgrunnientis]|jgi:tetratricopeptide (TPR) repeat protein|uniref:RagB/SusD family nutrient uptake outer membrane protein n=1 Tax=Sphingobacterium bovisgrunnientis TaxID=1874697 RepID=UPI00135CB705|nr:RagB/SusD family nutrient uptake outer membrane protein [Sphingobacterium bovisgrunnientis]HLS37974.1 RagB/SusD family nutrient uptake outer membrane protein [Sphingobacterium bovisgrunnientis]
MKNKILTSCLFVALTFSSCSDFLDVKPTNSADASTQTITTVADANVIIRGLMSKMASGNYYGRNFMLYADTKGGDYTITSQGRGYDYLYVFNHSETSNNYSSIWSQGYNCIAHINDLLVQIENLKAAGSSENFDTVIGQALTARALIYFDLVRLYGKPFNMDKNSFGVPITLTPLSSDAKLTRSSVNEVYTQILKDLKDAEPLITKPTNASTLANTNGFLNYFGNKAIQARVYLYMEDFENALAAAEEVIAFSQYKLYTNDTWVSSWSKQFGSESVFELAIYPNEGDLGNSSLGAYTRRRGNPNNTIAAGYFTSSTSFLARLNEDAQDVRKGIMTTDELSTTANPRHGAIYKYSGSVGLDGDGKGNSTAVNIKVIRLSEVYLIASEAALRKASPDLTKAVNYLNQIRKRSPNLTPASNASINIDLIDAERSKELIGEGHRFFDMMRWNKTINFDDALASVSTIHRAASIDRTFHKTILPIPLAEVNANGEIFSQQNPGYRN